MNYKSEIHLNNGLRTFIPRITLSPSDSSLPFTFKRRQFPVQPAFAMTINKSQGQTLNWVGLYLSAPVFAHRQLYVAYSRVTSRRNLKILNIKQLENNIDNDYVNNINLIECTCKLQRCISRNFSIKEQKLSLFIIS